MAVLHYSSKLVFCLSIWLVPPLTKYLDTLPDIISFSLLGNMIDAVNVLFVNKYLYQKDTHGNTFSLSDKDCTTFACNICEQRFGIKTIAQVSLKIKTNKDVCTIKVQRNTKQWKEFTLSDDIMIMIIEMFCVMIWDLHMTSAKLKLRLHEITYT